jgi:hypothetical protein
MPTIYNKYLLKRFSKILFLYAKQLGGQRKGSHRTPKLKPCLVASPPDPEGGHVRISEVSSPVLSSLAS